MGQHFWDELYKKAVGLLVCLDELAKDMSKSDTKEQTKTNLKIIKHYK